LGSEKKIHVVVRGLWNELGFGAKPKRDEGREKVKEEGGSQAGERGRERGPSERRAEVTRSKVAAARV
jgi:hypothetical protein